MLIIYHKQAENSREKPEQSELFHEECYIYGLTAHGYSMNRNYSMLFNDSTISIFFNFQYMTAFTASENPTVNARL